MRTYKPGGNNNNKKKKIYFNTRFDKPRWNKIYNSKTLSKYGIKAAEQLAKCISIVTVAVNDEWR